MGAKTNVLIADYQVITDRDTTEHIRTTCTTWSWTTLPAASTPTRP